MRYASRAAKPQPPQRHCTAAIDAPMPFRQFEDDGVSEGLSEVNQRRSRSALEHITDEVDGSR